MEERYYFAYGSNMNLEQMKYRCPAAEVVENVRLENYRLAFRGRAPGNGVATVLPEKYRLTLKPLQLLQYFCLHRSNRRTMYQSPSFRRAPATV